MISLGREPQERKNQTIDEPPEGATDDDSSRFPSFGGFRILGAQSGDEFIGVVGGDDERP
jgi:hypothetical protein